LLPYRVMRNLVQNIGSDAALFELAVISGRVGWAGSAVSSDHRRHALHEIAEVGAARWSGDRGCSRIAMGVQVDKGRGRHQPTAVQGRVRAGHGKMPHADKTITL